jgi:RND family efflux transporter MFP subunit
MNKPTSHRAVIATRAAVVVAVLILALLIFQLLAGSKPIVSLADPNKQLQRVNVFTASAVPVQRQWTGYGTAEAIDSANVPARVTATVTRIPSEILEGAAVTQGQVLVELDDSDYINQLLIAKQNLAGAEAQLAELETLDNWLTQRMDVETRDLELARDELARIKNLFSKNAANQKDVDAADRAALTAERSGLLVKEALAAIGPRRNRLRAEMAGLTSSVDIAQKNLDRCSIKSPIDGVIQFVDVEVGENLTLGQRVVRVVSLQRIQTPLSLSANARSHVRVGDIVRLTSTADPDLSWVGTITRIAPEDDPATRTFAAYVEVTSEQISNQKMQAPLAPGAFVSGVVMETDSRLRIVVPRRSIRTQRVMLIRNDVIETSLVSEDYAFEGSLPELGLPDEQWAVLDSGVQEGDTVVLNPTRTLSDGQSIQPVPVSEDTVTDRSATKETIGLRQGNSAGDSRGDVK